MRQDVEWLLSTLRDEGAPGKARADAARCLVDVGAEAVDGLVGSLASRMSGVRVLCAEALGLIGDASVVPRLVLLMADGEVVVRVATAVALGNIGARAAVHGLCQALQDRDQNVQVAAAEALGKIGDVRAVVPLMRVSCAPLASPRRAAMQALGGVGDGLALPARVVGDHRIPASERLSILQSIRELEVAEGPVVMDYELPPVDRYVRKCLQHADERVRRGARELLDCATLLRASDDAGSSTLLRLAESCEEASLLRPAHETALEERG